MINPNELKLVLLDRDGVINIDSADYIKSPEEWHPIEGSIEAIVKLQSVYTVVVCTNQAGVGRGLFGESELAAIHAKLNCCIADLGGSAVDIYYCPHHPDDKCMCRKPNPELLLLAMQANGATANQTIYIGDSEKDLLAAENAACHSALVLTGNGAETALSQVSKRAQITCEDLSSVASLLTQI